MENVEKQSRRSFVKNNVLIVNFYISTLQATLISDFDVLVFAYSRFHFSITGLNTFYQWPNFIDYYVHGNFSKVIRECDAEDKLSKK
jgi:hypothetical protein